MGLLLSLLVIFGAIARRSPAPQRAISAEISPAMAIRFSEAAIRQAADRELMAIWLGIIALSFYGWLLYQSLDYVQMREEAKAVRADMDHVRDLELQLEFEKEKAGEQAALLEAQIDALQDEREALDRKLAEREKELGDAIQALERRQREERRRVMALEAGDAGLPELNPPAAPSDGIGEELV